MKTIPCEVCGSNQHQFLFEGRDRVFGVPGKFNLVQCKECDLIFINPQPDADTLKAFYPGVYYESDPSHYREYSWLRKKVLEAYFGYEPPASMPQTMCFLRKKFLLPFRRRYLHSVPFIKGGRILDIGCGNGTELYKLKAMGWDAYGVEMDGQASERARSRGISVYTGDLFGAAYPEQFFHVVRMSFVLEHLPNPRETLQEIRRILVSKGRIYISIQNARSLHYWLFGQRWFSLDVPRHLFTFTPKTIERLLSSLDLEPKTIWFDSGTRSFLASLQYIVNDRYQRGAGYTASQSVVKSRFLRTLSTPICWFADQMGWGDLMSLEVVKP
ncbi:MAG TPA: class I SAM-dependent methyltransferase [Thermodesulfobacteriota bacterium]|nr:class I SAM-dependent methyltransferase [Thermodesulfobacteriota bacterium]